MKPRYRTLALLLTLSGCGCLCRSALAKDVTLNEIGKPLRLIAQDITAQTGSEITVDKNVAERKLFCMVRGIPEKEALGQIARVLGAQVTEKTEKGVLPHYTLTLRPEVAAWKRAYASARDTAFNRAVADTANLLFDQIQKELFRVPANTDEGKLSRMMPMQAWRTLASTYAGAMDGLSLTIDHPGRALSLREFTDLSSAEQETVRQILDKLPPNYADRMRNNITETYVAVSLRFGHDPTMGIGRRSEDGKAGRGYPFDLPFSLENTAVKRSALRKQYVNQWIGKHPVPPASVLDFAVTSLDAPDLATSGWDDRLPTLEKLPAGGMTRAELLTHLGRNFKLNLVSDYYTDDALLTEQGSDMKETLSRATRAFRCVWVQQGRWLLSRQVGWAEKDVTEAPYPIFEDCFALRYPKGDLSGPLAAVPFRDRPVQAEVKGDQLLPLSLLFKVCGLPHEQFRHLATFTRKDGFAAFRELTGLLDQGNSPALEYRKYGFLSGVPLENLTSTAGVTLANCPQNLWDEFNNNPYINASNQYKPLPPDARVRLKYYPAPMTNDDPMQGWQLELLCGPPPGIISADTSRTPAAPPNPAPSDKKTKP